MIYFNKLKNACFQKIENPICTITNELWEDFKYLTLGKDYDIIDGVFTDLRPAGAELQKAKEQKQAENESRAKQAIETGYIEFKGALFETNTQTLSDLNATRELNIISGQNYEDWLTKDDQIIRLNIDTENPENDDFIKIGLLVKTYKTTLWTEKYLVFKTLIETAETIEEVRSIEISYD